MNLTITPKKYEELSKSTNIPTISIGTIVTFYPNPENTTRRVILYYIIPYKSRPQLFFSQNGYNIQQCKGDSMQLRMKRRKTYAATTRFQPGNLNFLKENNDHANL